MITAAVTPADGVTATTTSNQICSGDSITLGVIKENVYGNVYTGFTWYNNGIEFTAYTGTINTTLTITPTNTGINNYSVVVNGNTCQAYSVVSVDVLPLPEIEEINILGLPKIICAYSSYEFELNAVGSKIETYVWGGFFGILTGATQNVTLPDSYSTGTLTIGLSAYSTNNVCYTTTATTITISPTPNEPNSNPSEQCGYGIPTCNVQSTSGTINPTFNWYNQLTGGTLLQSSTANTYSNYISATTTFYVSEIFETGCESTRATVVALVNPPDVITYSASSQSIALGNSFDVVISSVQNINVYTYVTISGTPETGSGVTGAESMPIGGTNPEITLPYTITPTEVGTYNYLVLAYDYDRGCTALVTFSVEVLPPPILNNLFVSGSSNTICAYNSYDFVFSASGTNIETYVWNGFFGELTGQTQNVTLPNSYSPQTLTVYLSAYSTNNVGYTTTATTIDIFTIPDGEAISVTPSTQCGYGIPACTVYYDSPGNVTLNWYDAPTGGNLLQSSGSTYNNYISATTTFYISAMYDNGCETTRRGLTATVNQPDPICYTASSQSITLGDSFDVTVVNCAINPQNVYGYTISGTTGSGVVGTEQLPYNGTPYTITPTLTGTYVYFVIAHEDYTNCTRAITFSVQVN
jgi:hypothetical protein